MVKRLALILLAPAALLSGCGMQTAEDLQPRPEPRDTCAMQAAEHLIGEPASVLDRVEFSNPTRVIHPGQPVTADYSARRLNILIGKDGRIASLNCG